MVFIPYHEVLNALFPAMTREHIFVLRVAEIPDTAKVVRVWDDAQRASFAFVFEDESFDIVDPGNHAPSAIVTLERIALDRAPAVTPPDPDQLTIDLG